MKYANKTHQQRKLYVAKHLCSLTIKVRGITPVIANFDWRLSDLCQC